VKRRSTGQVLDLVLTRACGAGARGLAGCGFGCRATVRSVEAS